ncbi:Equilibrative nucleoside transporter 2 [Chelonia mydas]|uniref:Equilibrative nucleoside transporter 2 n=1 Tax=Chelonia mydas TaxID=8469 RepID=M7BTX7_CHEMY|nr:Equilibrative nucleoside transporter 2 [Chelonia mydas]
MQWRISQAGLVLGALRWPLPPHSHCWPNAPGWPGDIPRSTQMARQDKPKDQFHAVGIIIFILGLGTLLPWNFFITAIPYFQARLIVGTSSSVGPGGNSSWGNSSGTQPAPARDDFNFNNWLTLLSQLPLLLFTLLNSFLYQCIPDKVRVLGSMSGILLLFILTAVLVRVEMPPHSFFSITIGSVWFINSFCAVLQGSLFGQLGTLPQGYSTRFLSGQGMAGTFAASAMLLSMASGVDAQTSALSYFITPCVGTLISIVCYLMLPRLAFFRHYMERNWQRDPHNELETKAGLLGPEEQSGDQLERPGEEPQGPEKPMVGMVNGTFRTLEEISVESSGKGAFALHNGTATNSQNRGPGPERPSVFGVLRKIWLLALCIVMVFTVTLSVFPAITATVTSTSESRQWSEFFTPVCCFLLFNVMDWMGRSVTSCCLWPEKRLWLLPVLVGLRFLFVPLLMLCRAEPRTRLPVLFHQDAWFILFMLPFSLSNGYFVSLTMCLAPKQVLPQESELAGAIMTFFLALGLSCGAGLSFLLKALL